jgi:hypothetical protein
MMALRQKGAYEFMDFREAVNKVLKKCTSKEFKKRLIEI